MSARYAASLSALPDALASAACVVDERGLITEVNTPLERLLGRPAADLVGQDAHDTLHRDRHGQPLPKAQCRLLEAFLARRAETGNAWFARGDGSVVELTWMMLPCVEAGGGAVSMVVFAEREPRQPAAAPGREAPTLSELERLALLAETTTQLTSTLDSDEALARLVRLVVPRLADWVVIDLITEADEVERAIVVHYQDGAHHRVDELQGPMPPVPAESPMPLPRALRGAAPTLVRAETYQGALDSGIAVEQRRLFEATRMHSAAIAPIRGVRDVLGALTLGRAERPDPMTPADLSLLEDISRRTGVALENARLYQRRRKVAETMQRHLLPRLPAVSGLEMAARYVAAPDASDVGGDWYDAFTLADGSTALAIGDVVGHDLDAAAGMAQVRSILRAYAWPRREKPSGVVHRLDESAAHLAGVPMATLVLGVLERTAASAWQLTWTNAGHPPPLLVTGDGRARYLTDAHGLLLGTGLSSDREDAQAALAPGSTLVLYTDGLVESREHSIDDGLETLRRHAAQLAHRPLPAFTDLLLERVGRANRTNGDDVALLTVRPSAPQPSR